MTTHFDTDWFSYAIKNFETTRDAIGPIKNILEIGVYQGRSTCWMLENMLDEQGHITCIDPFFESDPTPGFEFADVVKNTERERLFRSNIAKTKKDTQTISIMVDRSYNALAQLIVAKKQYDFIYVDGNHGAQAVLADACMCYGLLRLGGIMLFDDYLWDHEPIHHDRPKMSIDSFVNMFARQVRLFLINYQLAVVKIA